MQLPIELKQAIDNNAFCALATKVNEKEIQNHLTLGGNYGIFRGKLSN